MENKTTVAGYTLGTLGGFVFLGVIITGFSSCKRNEDRLNAQIAVECIQHGGQLVGPGQTCVQPSRA
jgi:hypothetical protein